MQAPHRHVQRDVIFLDPPDHLREGVELGYIHVDTGDSLTSWGGTLNQASVRGSWASFSHHINLLELGALQNVLHHFAPQLNGKHLIVRSNNMPVLAYIKRRGHQILVHLVAILRRITTYFP